MALTINLRSEIQILGDLVRAMLSETDLNALEPGSDLASLLEAIALSQAEIEVSALKILESNKLESLTGNNLDKKADSIRIPNGIGGIGRKPSTQSIGPVSISDGTFSKITTKPYAGKPSPFAGSTVLYVEDGADFLTYLTDNGSGSIYLGRGTVDRFEGPIPFTSVTNSGSFWIIQLATPLSKSHLISEEITLAQGGDRTVVAGTSVQVPGNSEQSAVSYTTNETLIIPDGEDTGTVNVTCTQFGEIGNSLINTITTFQSVPFTGAQVTNTTTFRSGKDAESDEDLRQRIKSYPSTLSRGTSAAILGAILGATDPLTGRTIQSASILDPVEPGDFARVFIDDGAGLEPSYGGQPYELLIDNATGQETRFAASQTPITAATVIGANSGPFVLNSSLTMTVRIDDVFEDFVITPSNYQNINSTNGYEIARDLNSQTNLLAFRTINNGKQIVLTDLSGKSERLQVLSGDLQEVLGLPIYIARPLYLYKNSELLSFKGKTATLQTRAKSAWTGITAADFQDIQVKVDGVLQVFSIDDADFAEFGTTVPTATIAQWVSVFKKKVAGVKFIISGQVIVWQTWQDNSSSGSLEILDVDINGNPAGWVSDSKVWTTAISGGKLSDVGSAKDYSLNRFTGEITLDNKPEEGSKIEIATRSTNAFFESIKAPSGLYSLAPSATVGNARLVVSFDGVSLIRESVFVSGSILVPTEPDATNAKNIIRLTANNTNVWSEAQVGDWLYLIEDSSAGNTWGSKVEGFYRVKTKGLNNIATSVTYNSPLLLGTTNGATNLNLATITGTNFVNVTYNSHGLKSGDKATITSGVAVGGISSVNLTVANATVVYVDANNFKYQASAIATSDASVTDPSITAYTNVITITQTLHPYTTGNVANIASTTNLAGILSGNLTVASAEVTVVDANTIQYRAVTAATSIQGGSFFSTVSIPSTWVEFEVSDDQYTDWSALLTVSQNLTDTMVNLFKSTSIPQLIDFGSLVSNLTVDQIVDSINSQIVSGAATKINPQQFKLNSLSYNELESSVAVLALIGNASNILTLGTSSGQQAHVAFSTSQGVQSGSLITSGNNYISFGKTAPSGNYPTREYLKFEQTFTDITDELVNPTITTPTTLVTTYPTGFQHLWMTGRQYGINTRVYNNQTTAPFSGFARGSDMINPLNTTDTTQTNPDSLDRYSNFGIKFRDLPFNNSDKFVVEMDLDATNKTVAIQMAKKAKILDIDSVVSGSKGQVISFRLKDPDNADLNFFDNTSVYKDFNFEDFKILAKSVGVYKTTGGDRALVIRSVDFGGQSKVTFSILYPTIQDQADVVVSHSTEYTNGIAQLNVTATLPSLPAINTASYLNNIYQLKSTVNGNIFDWRVSAGSLGSNPGFTPGRLLNIGNNGGVSGIDGSFKITASSYISLSSVFASTTNTSPVIQCTSAAHGLTDGALIDVVSAVAIGGISAVNITQTNIPVTVTGLNTFEFTALSNATSNSSGSISTVTQGVITVSAPSDGGFGVTPVVINAVFNPITCFPLVNTNLTTVATAINNYLTDNPVATAEAIGSTLSTSYITDASYIDNSLTPAYAGQDVGGGLAYHIFSCKYTNGAGIWQYDSSNPLLNEIKATVQNDDSIFPTITEASGTSYTPINEEVLIVPTNTKTLADWVNFKAASSLNVIASADRVHSDELLQITTKSDGSEGAVKVTGVNANQVLSAVVGNAEESGSGIKVQIASADAKSLSPGSLVKVQNTLSTEIQRTYRYTPTGTEITAANTIDTATYFRDTNGVQYLRTNITTGRFIFRRNGINLAQSEPIILNNTITFTNLGNGLVQVTLAQGTALSVEELSARVGDMMYIPQNSNIPSNAWCKTPTLANGVTTSTTPEYLGYPVVRVIDGFNIVVIAPNIASFGVAYSVSPTDLIFLPAVWNEKNIRTSYKEGAKFFEPYNQNKLYYLVKKLNSGMALVVAQNSATQATDTMRLGDMSVNTDDYAVIGEGFAASNQGTFKIIGHNTSNQLIIYNPDAVDEIIETNTIENGGYGSRIWRNGPIQTQTRPIRIISCDSVRVGDYLRISSPADTLSSYFDSNFFGSWQITGIGLHAFTYSGSAPYTAGTGSVDLTKLSPYIEVYFPNGAPLSIKDNLGLPVGEFILGDNNVSVGFVENEPTELYRLVAGSAVNATNFENGDLFLVPQAGIPKISSIFGSSVQSLNKIGFELKTDQGIDGYTIYTEIIQTAQNIIDGKPSNAVIYPGVKAVGTTIEVLVPLNKIVSISLSVKPKDGVTLNSISDLVKSSVSGYINGLGVGQPVVMSQVIRVVQGLPGVFSVEIVSTFPAVSEDRIVVASQERAKVLDANDIIVG